jgi:hypothetical protein
MSADHRLDSSSESDPRRRAHELYVERGNESGSELDDWLQAEEEIFAQPGTDARRKLS